MKKQQAIDLDREYTPNTAAEARQKERERLARWEAGATARELERRRVAAEEARRAAEPITDDATLSEGAAALAVAWGLKKRRS